MSTVCLMAISFPLPPEVMEMKYWGVFFGVQGLRGMNSHYTRCGNFPTKWKWNITKHLECHKRVIQFHHFHGEGGGATRSLVLIAAPTLPSTDSCLQGLCFKHCDLHGENTSSIINITLTQLQKEAKRRPDTVHIRILFISKSITTLMHPSNIKILCKSIWRYVYI